MSFTDEEIAYLRSQRLARIATVSQEGQPDVAPVGFEFDGTHFYVGGRDPARTRKFLNVEGGNDRVALVVDDLITHRFPLTDAIKAVDAIQGRDEPMWMAVVNP